MIKLLEKKKKINILVKRELNFLLFIIFLFITIVFKIARQSLFKFQDFYLYKNYFPSSFLHFQENFHIIFLHFGK